MVDVNRIYKAIDYLKTACNPYYQFYDDYHTYEERCVNSDDGGLVASSLHGEELDEHLKATKTTVYVTTDPPGYEKYVEKILEVINFHGNNINDLFPEETALDETGGEKCIIPCTKITELNPAGYEDCVKKMIIFNMLGIRITWFECECIYSDISK